MLFSHGVPGPPLLQTCSFCGAHADICQLAVECAYWPAEFARAS